MAEINTAAMTSNSKKGYITKRTNLLCGARKNKRRNLPRDITIIKNRAVGPRPQRTRKNKRGESILGNIVKLRTN